MKKIFITGTAGFIGFHLAKNLLNHDFEILGYDGLTDYYDVRLKEARHAELAKSANFRYVVGMLEDKKSLSEAISDFSPAVIVHLAAQAGVRYSIENPSAYIQSNIVGTFNLVEAAREISPVHLLMASTSSVYGANDSMPFDERQNVNTPLTLYAATKAANESMGHSYANLWNIPTTMFRFFTVYGTWGRPDLALYKFVEAILDDRPIDIYNNGDMYRDFTYVDDLVEGIRLLIDAPPQLPSARHTKINGDSISPVAPFRVVNIGNSEKIHLMDFIEAIEEHLGIKAQRNYMPMQMGDVPATWANADLLAELTGYQPKTNFKEGIKRFIDWYRVYKGI